MHHSGNNVTDQAMQSTATAGSNDLSVFSRLPPEIVCAAFRHLTLDELMAATSVCRYWRQISIEAPELWSRIPSNLRPALLSLVLGRSRDVPVEILELLVVNENDSQLNTVLSHMHHIRTLALRFFSQQTGISPGSPAHNILSSQAPMLRHLSILSNPRVRTPIPLNTISAPFNGVAPLLKTVQIMAFARMAPFIALLPEPGRSRIHTFTFGGDGCSFSFQMVESLFSLMPSLRILNAELWEWRDEPQLGESHTIPTTLQQLNIRVTNPQGLFPQQMLPDRPGWERIPRVHIAYSRAIRFDDINQPAVLPTNGTHIVELEVRKNIHMDSIHVRVVHSDGCVRMYCGMHLDHAVGLLDNRTAANVKTLIVSAAACTASMICALDWPSLTCLRLVTDGLSTDVTAFATTLAQAEVQFGGLQRIEHASPRQSDPLWGADPIKELLRKATRDEGVIPEVYLVTLWSGGIPQEGSGGTEQPDPEWFLQPPFEWI